MKRVNLLTKYSLLFFTFFLVVFIFLSKVIDISNEALLISSLALILFYLISVYFIYKEINVSLKKIFSLSDRLKLRDSESGNTGEFDRKISEINGLISELETMKSGYVMNREIYRITNEFYSIAKRTLHELETAKVFKVDRNEFLGNVAHELRTPIFAIQLSLETLLDGAINDENVNIDFLNRAFIQTKRLTELVDDLISISKFETGVKMSRRYFAIENIVRSTIDELSALAAKKNISVNFFPPDIKDVKVFGDEQRLQQVLVNLIDNAVKYTPSDGNVNVSIDVQEKEVWISVEDTGIGIPQKDIKRIFERFYRVDKTRSREIGGSGLGLSIVKHILEAHSSQIKVESEPNLGSRFAFSLKR
ncbi:MAG: ATP-binding protein [Ignavibacteria bacterium]|nr:ATP-binding protein [Ignavibacteria bacterium]